MSRVNEFGQSGDGEAAKAKKPGKPATAAAKKAAGAAAAAAAAFFVVVDVEYSFLENHYCWSMEKVPRALASTPAAFSLESRLPLERELHSKCALLKAQLRRQRLPLDTSSQFTPRRPGQRGPQTQARRSRSRLPRNSRKLVEAQLRRQRLPLDTSSQFTPRRPGQRGPQTQERRSRSRLPRELLKLVFGPRAR